MSHPRLALIATCLLTALGAHGFASAADGSQPGLRLRASPGSLGSGTALVDMALPRPSFLGHALFNPWWNTSSVSALRTSSSWRALGGDVLPTQGLRASGGLVGVSRMAAYGATPAGERAVVDLAMTTPRGAWAQSLTVSVPYIGVGYTGFAGDPRQLGGWGFSADVGLMALAPRSTVRLDRANSGAQNLDDAVRDLRLSPLMQLGVSYTF